MKTFDKIPFFQLGLEILKMKKEIGLPLTGLEVLILLRKNPKTES